LWFKNRRLTYALSIDPHFVEMEMPIMPEGYALSDVYGGSAVDRDAAGPLPAGKTRITIRLDDDILHWFRSQVAAAGGGSYQALINTALREHMRQRREPLEATLRRVVREEWERNGAGAVASRHECP
jgi:hypothetical protein